MKYEVIIIGGGISGAILATKLKNKKVLIIDSNDKLMKKIYATGNGRCNITNKYLTKEAYHSDDLDKAYSIISESDNYDFINYLNNYNLKLKIINDCYYPRSLQASSLIEKIEKNISADIKLNENVINITKENKEFIVKTDKTIYKADNVVNACGSLASNINKFKFSPYDILEIDIIKPLPALCGILSDKKYIKKLKGVRVDACLTLKVDNVDIKREVGNLQFIDKGISGIVVFQLSSLAIRSLYEGKKVDISIDYMYDLDKTALKEDLYRAKSVLELEDILQGYLPKKLVDVIFYLAYNKKMNFNEVISKVYSLCTNHIINMVSYEDYIKAQTCSGGVSLRYLSDSLKDEKGIYYIGEIVNVDGVCGGYNIQWAYSSASRVAKELGRS